MNKYKIITILLLSLILGTTISYYTLWRGCLVISNGQRIGELQKISTVGLFIKTTEGELALFGSGGSYKGKAGQGNSDFVSSWSFSIDNPEVAVKIDDMVKHGKTHVRLEYIEYYFKGIYNSNYRVTTVESINKE